MICALCREPIRRGEEFCELGDGSIICEDCYEEWQRQCREVQRQLQEEESEEASQVNDLANGRS